MSDLSPGALFRAAVKEETPLQVIGTINAYSAMLAQRVGYKAIYLSGGGIANASYGLPDLGMTTLNDVLEDVRRITSACALPLLVDIDTGWGNAFMINRTIKQMIRAGAAAVHIEDQIASKRCGHRPNKAIVSTREMVDRVKAAVDAKTDSEFVIMARTDALAVEGLDAAIERACLCQEAGADMIFPEAITELDMYQKFAAAVGIPILANITEFGQTPLFTVEQLREVNVGLILYPLSAFRAQAQATLNVYTALRQRGTQESVIDIMQPRMELYECLGYHEYEQKLDELYAEEKLK